MSYFYVTSRLKSVFSTAHVHLFSAESGMRADYAFDQLMGFSDLLKFGRFAYSARFAYTRIGNSTPPNVP